VNGVTILQDLRYALRVQTKSPGFTAIAILALALGIGANSAIFSVVNALLIRDLPFQEPDRLVMVFEKNRRRNRDRNVISPANFRDWKAQNRVFERMSIFNDVRVGLLAGSGGPEEVPAQSVGEDFFETLGVQAMLGRTFTPAEYRINGPGVVILSHGVWTRRFGSDPNIIGKSVPVHGTAATITGVMPASFRTTNRLADVWLPLRLDPGRDYRATSGRSPLSVARLKPGVTLAQAQSEMDTISSRLEREYPAFNTGWGSTVVPLREQIVGDVRLAVLVLLAAVGCVLLIACANVANLLLARAATRKREIAIRASLGAGRARVIRQLLTESLLLSFAAGVLGYLLALWGVEALVALSPKNLPMRDQLAPDLFVLAFNIGISMITGILFGLAPALAATRTDLVVALKQGAAGGGGGTGKKTRNVLVAAEVAISLMLLIGAGLLIRSFSALQSIHPGFNGEQVLTARISLPSSYREPDKGNAFFIRTLGQIRQVPGVQSASGVTFLPMTGIVSGTSFRIDGLPRPGPGQSPTTQVTTIDPEFFRTMNIPLLRGRFFTPQDQRLSPRVYIVTEAFAKKTFPNEDAIGKRIIVAMGDDVPGEIVGIVGDIRYTSLTEPVQPTVFYPHTQLYVSFMHLLVRSSLPPQSLATAMSAAVRSIDPQIPLADVRPMDAVLAESIARSRFTTTLLTVFAGFAFLLAAIGIYGVMAYNVSQRTQEIGVRMALGAQAGNVLRLVFRQAIAVVAAGLLFGIGAALALSRLMTNLLYGVKPIDAFTFIAVPCALLIAAMLAAYIPARRATRIEPVRALRYE
jgi:putative ABC transport system permease protein